jgi:excisionase family DNA binding protein
MMISNELPDVLTADETAQYLRFSVATVYRLAQAGEIPAARIGRVWRFQRELLDEWLNERMRGNLRRDDDSDE